MQICRLCILDQQPHACSPTSPADIPPQLWNQSSLESSKTGPSSPSGFGESDRYEQLPPRYLASPFWLSVTNSSPTKLFSRDISSFLMELSCSDRTEGAMA